MKYLNIICGFIFIVLAILEWLNIFTTNQLTIGFLWLIYGIYCINYGLKRK